MVMSAAAKAKPRTHMTDNDRAHEAALALVEEQFRDFDLVWAKVGSFPWWPAVVFHSWDVVRGAGLPTEEKKLPVPEPRRVPVLDANGAETGDFRVVVHCLVMFVDQFNFSVVEIGPKAIVSFVAYYNKNRNAVINAKANSKLVKYRKRFNEALTKADGLLHMNSHAPSNSSLLEAPKVAEKPVKKRRTDPASKLPPPSPLDDESFDDAWDDAEMDEDEQREGSDGGDNDDTFELPSETRSRRGNRRSDSESSEAPYKKKKGGAKTTKKTSNGGGSLKGKGIVKRPTKPATGAASARRPSKKSSNTADDSDDFEPPRSLKIQRKKTKGPANDPIDLTSTPESAKKQGKKSVKAKSKLVKPPVIDSSPQEAVAARGKSKALGTKKVGAEAEVADLTELVDDDGAKDTPDQESDSRAVVMTPLSSIWTTKVDAAESTIDASSRLVYKQDFVWDTSVFTDNDARAEEEATGTDTSDLSKPANGDAIANANGRERSLGKRQPRSVQQAQIRQNLMFGNLDPHTMVQCESYRQAGEEENTRSRGLSSLPPPFTVVVHPDATFVSDLHAHLATCEIIGFLGGKWDEASKTLFIQAAFPCRSLMIDGDDGSTDVEMDPGSEIELRGIINDAELEVVGWYHSHPAFAPDPSIRDIENQSSYQQLFKRTQTLSGSSETTEPFVGLIVGTYDTRRDTPVSLFRYFHVRGEKVSGGARREIFMPYEFIPKRRHYRSVLTDEANEKIRALPVYPSVLKALGLPRHFRSASSVVAATKPDEKTQSEASATVKASPPRRKSAAVVRKRKQSVDIGAAEAPAKRSRRGRKKRVADVPDAVSQIDLTMDDAEEIQPRDEADEEVSVVNVIDGSESGQEETRVDDAKTNGAPKVMLGTADAGDVVSTSSQRGGVTDAGAIGANCGDQETAAVQIPSDNHAHGSVGACDLEAKVEAREQPSDGVLPKDVKMEAIAASDGSTGAVKQPVLTARTATVTPESPTKNDTASLASQPGSSTSSDFATKDSDEVRTAPADTVAKRKPTPSVVTDGSAEAPNHLSAGVSPSSATSSGRRRKRKPVHTSKKPWSSERSPKSEGPRDAPNNSSSMPLFSYFDALQSMGSNNTRHDNRSEPVPKIDAAIEKPRAEAVEERLPVESRQYYFIGETDAKSATDTNKTIIAAPATNSAWESAVGAPAPTPGHCSTDDEIEIVVVNEDSKLPETNPTTAADHSTITTSERKAAEAALGHDQPQSAASIPSKTEDSGVLVQVCLDELVDKVVSDATLSSNQTVKCEQPVDGASSSVPPSASDADPDMEPSVASDPEPTRTTSVPTVEVQSSSSECAAGGEAVDGAGLRGAIAVEATAPDGNPPMTSITEDEVMQDADADVAGLSQDHGAERAAPPTSTCFAKSVEDIKTEPAAVKHEVEATAEATPVKPETTDSADEKSGASVVVKDAKPLLFGRERQHEDIRTSLEKMDAILKRTQPTGGVLSTVTPTVVSESSALPDVKATELTAAASEPSVETPKDTHAATVARMEAHLASLRTRYGPGMVACVAQVVTLVDYYRDFERRIDLSEPWKGKMSKLRKIEASLSEYVQYLNLSVALRRAFVEDLVGYLELSWALTRLDR